MRGQPLQGAGLGLMVWLGGLIPFHRLPLPEGYALIALSLAIIAVASGVAWPARQRVAASALAAMAPALAMIAAQAGYIDASHQRWIGPMMIGLAILALLEIVRRDLRSGFTRVARMTMFLAAGCVIAVVLLAAYLPITRLHMPILTAVTMLMIAGLGQWLTKRRND